MSIYDGPGGRVVFMMALHGSPYQIASLPVDHSPGDQWQVRTVPHMGRYTLDFGGRRLGQMNNQGTFLWYTSIVLI